mmetsp:Transcript_10527/g.32387  ORF Transcript_10527/g.32387 Transcript_10527/m.32387 type:complete len:237 (-) Transcript_10527:1137-1847(-)
MKHRPVGARPAPERPRRRKGAFDRRQRELAREDSVSIVERPHRAADACFAAARARRAYSQRLDSHDCRELRLERKQRKKRQVRRAIRPAYNPTQIVRFRRVAEKSELARPRDVREARRARQRREDCALEAALDQRRIDFERDDVFADHQRRVARGLRAARRVVRQSKRHSVDLATQLPGAPAPREADAERRRRRANAGHRRTRPRNPERRAPPRVILAVEDRFRLVLVREPLDDEL